MTLPPQDRDELRDRAEHRGEDDASALRERVRRLTLALSECQRIIEHALDEK